MALSLYLFWLVLALLYTSCAGEVWSKKFGPVGFDASLADIMLSGRLRENYMDNSIQRESAIKTFNRNEIMKGGHFKLNLTNSCHLTGQREPLLFTRSSDSLKSRLNSIQSDSQFIPWEDPAEKWNMEYLRQQFQGDLLGVDHSKSNHFLWFNKIMARSVPKNPSKSFQEPTTTEYITFDQFINLSGINFRNITNPAIVDVNDNEDFYYFQTNSKAYPFMAEDLPQFSSSSPLMDSQSDSSFFKKFGSSNIQCRIGPSNIVSEMHFDAGDNFILMVKGSKRYILIPPQFCHLLNIQVTGPTSRHSNYNFMDESTIDLIKQLDIPVIDVIVNEGDILYIPSYWLHYIIAQEDFIQCNVRNKRLCEGAEDIFKCGFNKPENRFLYSPAAASLLYSNHSDFQKVSLLALAESDSAAREFELAIVDDGGSDDGALTGYVWQADSWSDCSVPCGGGTQTRSLLCYAPDGSVSFNNARCSASPSPPTSQSCNTQPCASSCPSNCVHSGCNPDGTCVADDCTNPRGSCDWYANCLERQIPCANTQYSYALDYGAKFCNLYGKNYNSFNEHGRKWIDSVRLCLQVALSSTLQESYSTNGASNPSCDALQQAAFDSHVPCYTNPSPDLSICDGGVLLNLPQIIKTIAPAFTSALWPTLKQMGGTASACVRILSIRVKNAASQYFEDAIGNAFSSVAGWAANQVVSLKRNILPSSNPSIQSRMNLMDSQLDSTTVVDVAFFLNPQNPSFDQFNNQLPTLLNYFSGTFNSSVRVYDQATGKYSTINITIDGLSADSCNSTSCLSGNVSSTIWNDPVNYNLYNASRILDTPNAQSFSVTVDNKTIVNPWFNQGSGYTFLINGVQGATLNLTKGQTYFFDLSLVPSNFAFILTTDPNGGSKVGYITGNNSITKTSSLHGNNNTIVGFFYTAGSMASLSSIFYQSSYPNQTKMGGTINIISSINHDPIQSIRLNNSIGFAGFGRLEVLYNNVWGTVCSTSFTYNDAVVVCNQLGFNYSSSSTTTGIPPLPSFVSNSLNWPLVPQPALGPIWLSTVSCKGSESSIGMCSYDPIGVQHCQHYQDTIIQCSSQLRLCGIQIPVAAVWTQSSVGVQYGPHSSVTNTSLQTLTSITVSCSSGFTMFGSLGSSQLTGSCVDGMVQWSNNIPNLNNVTCVDQCSLQTSCSSCTRLVTCGWCLSSNNGNGVCKRTSSYMASDDGKCSLTFGNWSHTYYNHCPACLFSIPPISNIIANSVSYSGTTDSNNITVTSGSTISIQCDNGAALNTSGAFPSLTSITLSCVDGSFQYNQNPYRIPSSICIPGAVVGSCSLPLIQNGVLYSNQVNHYYGPNSNGFSAVMLPGSYAYYNCLSGYTMTMILNQTNSISNHSVSSIIPVTQSPLYLSCASGLYSATIASISYLNPIVSCIDPCYQYDSCSSCNSLSLCRWCYNGTKGVCYNSILSNPSCPALNSFSSPSCNPCGSPPIPPSNSHLIAYYSPRAAYAGGSLFQYVCPTGLSLPSNFNYYVTTACNSSTGQWNTLPNVSCSCAPGLSYINNACQYTLSPPSSAPSTIAPTVLPSSGGLSPTPTVTTTSYFDFALYTSSGGAPFYSLSANGYATKGIAILPASSSPSSNNTQSFLLNIYFKAAQVSVTYSFNGAVPSTASNGVYTSPFILSSSSVNTLVVTVTNLATQSVTIYSVTVTAKVVPTNSAYSSRLNLSSLSLAGNFNFISFLASFITFIALVYSQAYAVHQF